MKDNQTPSIVSEKPPLFNAEGEQLVADVRTAMLCLRLEVAGEIMDDVDGRVEKLIDYARRALAGERPTELSGVIGFRTDPKVPPGVAYFQHGESIVGTIKNLGAGLSGEREDSERLDWLAKAGVILDRESLHSLPESYYHGELTLREAIDRACSTPAEKET